MLIIQIHNDGTGKDDIDNYDYKVYINKNCIEKGRVEGHNRADGWRELVDNLVHKAKKVETEGILNLKAFLKEAKNINWENLFTKAEGKN